MPALPSYGYGREHPGPRYSSLIHGQNLTDVVITGVNFSFHDKSKQALQNTPLALRHPLADSGHVQS